MRQARADRRAIHNNGAARGFTLIEIMVAIAILAIAAAAVIPTLGGDKGSRQLQAATVAIADGLAYCYSAAVTEGRPYRWSWEEDNRRWRILREEDPRNKPGEWQAVMAAGQTGATLPSLVQMGGIYRPVVSADEEEKNQPPEKPELSFYPEGRCDQAMIVLLLVPKPGSAPTGRPEEAMTVALNGFSGQTKILKGDIVNQPAA